MFRLTWLNSRWLALPGGLLLALFMWAGDRVTLQGERTIYTVICVNGAWAGNSCSGQIGAGPRYRYRALKARGEVLFWVVGAQEPSSKLVGCTIEDGRNWICPESADASKSITLTLTHGKPLRNSAGPTLPFHAVSKLSWKMLDAGLASI